MLEKMKRTLDGVFSGGQGIAAIERNAPRISITSPSNDTAASEIVDLLHDRGVPTTFFLCGTRTEPHVLPEPEQIDEQPVVPPEPFFARTDRSDDLLTRLRPEPTPCFVRLPHAGGHETLRVHRLLDDRQSDCLLVHWASPEEEDSAERDLVARCRAAAEHAFAEERIAGTLILMREDAAERDLSLSAHLAPLLLREVLSGARQPHWAVVGIGAPLPA